ncbi:unnamed protein product [Amoebophrya sp. A120]|nr:unnamed protein product [Amoebophrya sp. A120]|eukprot:GSA120T00008544001.1
MILLEVPVRNLFARWSRKAQYEAKNARDGTTVKRPDSPSFLWPALCARRSGFFDQKLVLAFLTEGEEEGSPASEEKKQQLTIALRADSAALKADERQALTEMLKQVQNVSLLLPRVQGRVWNAAELQVLLKTSSKNGSELVAPRTWSAARIMEDHEHDQRQVGEQPEPSKILLNHFLDLAETEQHAYLLITHPVVEGVWSVEEEEQGREVEHTRKLHDHLHDDLRSGGLIQREVKARVVSRKLWLYGMPFRLVFPSNESNQLVYNKIPKLERIWAGEEDEG